MFCRASWGLLCEGNRSFRLNAEADYAYWSLEQDLYIRDILNAIEEIDTNNGEVFTDPIVFIPVVEDRDIDSLKHELCEVPAQAVIAMEYDTSTLTCIGYDLDSYNNLSQTSSIDEDLAWTTDVWVFSQEEVTGTNIAGGRSVSYIDEAEINYQQIVDGRTDYGGLI